MKRIKTICILLLIGCCVMSCQEDFLEIKPDQSLLVPTRLSDLQQILDNSGVMNYAPGLQTISSDDYFINNPGTLASLTPQERNSYLWEADVFEGTTIITDWNMRYEQVFYSNIVLETLNKIGITADNRSEWEAIKGSALFYRAMAFYKLLNQFAAPYDPSTASIVPGIPLKLSADVNERPKRSTVQNSYEKLMTDLRLAYTLLPDVQEIQLTRPSKLAVAALLARANLTMGNYKEAMDNADEVIKSKPTLMDFNSLSKTSTRPIPFNTAAETEVIFWQYMTNYGFGRSAAVSVSPEIISSYETGDLRKVIFLRDRGNGIFTFKGSYTGGNFLFTGLATDEMYLIRAECRARLGDVNGAMQDVNTLLKKRWDNNVPYPEFKALDADEALRFVLAERRKEMVTRGQRWADLRRLNLDTRFKKTLYRTVDGEDYELPPNDKKYTFPIPNDEINLSGLEQNDR